MPNPAFNPHTPNVVGVEWLASRRRWDSLSRTIGRGTYIANQAPEAFNRVEAFLRFERGPTTSATVACDVYAGLPGSQQATIATVNGTVTQAAAANGAWVTFTFPTEVAAGAAYSIVLRIVTAGYAVSWAALDTRMTVGHELERLDENVNAFEVTLNEATGLPLLTPDLTLDTAARALMIRRTAGTYLPVSQPYHDVPMQVINVGSSATQTLIAAAAMTVGQVYVMVRNDVTNARLPFPLVMDVTVGTTTVTAQVNTANLPRPPDARFYRLHAAFDPPLAVTAGATMTVRLYSLTPASDPWRITELGATTALGPETFGGTTQYGRTSSTDWQVATEILLAPVEGFSVGVMLLDVSHDRTNCCVPELLVPFLDWPDTNPLGEDLVRYEIERFDDGVWRPIARVTRAEAPIVIPPAHGTSAFIDMEALRNTPVHYRIRAVNGDGVGSAWASAGPIALPSADVDVLLTTNWRQDLFWAGMDEPGYTWEPVDADRLTTRMLYGRNRHVAFREIEERGDRFSRSLIVAFNDPNMPRIPPVPRPAPVARYVPPGREVFDPLLAVAHARDVPYVCFLDGRGRRWYTAPAVSALHEDQPAQQYRADATFVEVSEVPFPAVLPYLEPSPIIGQGWDYTSWDEDGSGVVAGIWEVEG